MKKKILLLTIFFLIVAIAYADWVPVDCPQKGNISKVIINRTNDSIMFALSYNKVYKTIDNGENWCVTFESNESLEIFSIAPNNQNVIYTKEWKSIDGGESWIPISPIPYYSYPHNQIAINPNNPNIVFSSHCYNGIYRTINGGASWELVQDIHAYWSAYDNLTPSIMYSISSSSVYKSTDGGNSWNWVYSISNYPYFCGNLIVSNHNLYCLMGEWIYGEFIVKSIDGGSSWFELNLNPDNYDISIINDLCVSNGIIYASTDKGLYSSDEDGINWERISSDYDYLQTVDVSSKILTGSRLSGVSTSPLTANDWINIGIIPLTHYATRVISSIDGVKICNDNDAIYKQAQNSQYWKTIIPPIGENYSFSCAAEFSKMNPNKLFAVVNDKLFISEDAGDDWSYVEEVPAYVQDNIISISSDDLKIFLCTGSSVLRTTNGGVSWSIKQIPGTYLRDLHYSNNNTLYILDDTGYYYSTNDGNNWSLLDSGLPYNGVIIPTYEIYYDINENDRIFCNIRIDGDYDRQVYEKQAGVYVWSLLYNGTMLEEVPLITRKIVAEPNSDNLYGVGEIYIQDNGEPTIEEWLFRSDDGGITWERCSNEFDFDFYSKYSFLNYEPYEMIYCDENSDFWLGDVQNMHGVAVEPEVEYNFDIQVCPNPFKGYTIVSFSVKENSYVELVVYNIKGQKIKTITNRLYNKGAYQIKWYGDDNYGNNVKSGVYLYRLDINSKTEIISKCLLVK